MIKKLLTGFLLLLLLLFPLYTSIQAAPSIPLNASSMQGIQPRINYTGYKYKTINGKRYKRLWSYTYNRWEEPNWTPV